MIDPTIIVAVIGGLTAIAAGIVSGRFTSRAAREAQKSMRELEEKKLDASTWQQQVESWRQDAVQLRQMREEDKRHFDEELDECMQRTEELEDQYRQLREAFDVAMASRSREMMYMHSVQEWCRQVTALLKAAGISYPPAPPGLVDTDPKGFPIIRPST